jgi:hypothetical protein
MSLVGLFWCGEGDLFFEPPCRICKLLSRRSAKSARNAENAVRGHNLGTRNWGEPRH